MCLRSASSSANRRDAYTLRIFATCLVNNPRRRNSASTACANWSVCRSVVCLTCRKPLDGGRRRHDPSDAQPGKRHLREAIDVNHQICAVQMLQRRHTLFAGMQARVDVILDDGYLVASGQIEQLAARSQRHRRARRILKIRRQHDQLHAVCRQRRFQCLEVDSQRRARLRRACAPARPGIAPARH